jgi:PAS domain S-box-containing protein
LNSKAFRYFLRIVAITFACFVSAQLSSDLLYLGAQPSPIWAPAGIALASLLRYGRKVWPGTALGTFLFALSLNVSWGMALGAGLGSTIGAIAGQKLLQRARFSSSLRSLRDVLLFLALAVFLSPIVNATMSTLNGYVWGMVSNQQILMYLSAIWLGDGMGILVITPLLLAWMGRPLPPVLSVRSHSTSETGAHTASPREWIQTTWQRSCWFRQKIVEASIWGALLVWVCWKVFLCIPTTATAHYPLEYLPFSLIAWAALRLGQRGTVLGSLFVSAIAIWGTVHHLGPFVAETNGDRVQAILLLQFFVGVMSMTALVLAAAISERRDSEEQFRRMFDGAAIGIGLDNLQGQMMASNPALQAMLGYRAEELNRMSFAEFTHPDDLASDWELFEAMIAGKRDAYQMEKRHIRKNGQVIWVRLTNSLVRDEAGNPQFIIGMVENITELKQAEEALLHSEARFRVVAETAACAIMVYQGKYLRYVNPATEAITEYPRNELLSIPFWELAHPEFRDLVKQRGLARQRGESVPQRYEIKILTKTGKERWVDFTGGVITYEGRPAGIATAYDITDRKNAEAQLRFAAQRERLLAEVALRIRRSLNVEEILNTTVAEVRQFLQADRVFIAQVHDTGYCRTVAESVAPDWPSIIGWEIHTASVQEIRSLFQCNRSRVVHDTNQVEKSPFLTEYYSRTQLRAGMGVLLHVNGEMFGVLIVNQCSAPRQWQPFEVELLQQLATQVEIAIQQGQLYQKVQNFVECLECQVEERTAELQQRMQELQQLNQVKDLLLHAVSHDLKTPVQGTLMLLNKLRSKCQDQVSLSSAMLDRMILSINQQLHLLHSLSEGHADVETTPSPSCKPVALSDLVQVALETVAPLLAQNQVQLQNLIPTDLPAVKADTQKLQQVFIHLLTNAAKHNPPGISLTLTATLRAPSKVPFLSPHPSLSSSSPCVLYCTIEDTGIGMSQETCDRLFHLYVRGMDNPHLTGIGLGLHTCRQIITAHGGQIGVTSQPGTGSKFWFTLPLGELR